MFRLFRETPTERLTRGLLWASLIMRINCKNSRVEYAIPILAVQLK
jgi:hypothetical protein